MLAPERGGPYAIWRAEGDVDGLLASVEAWGNGGVEFRSRAVGGRMVVVVRDARVVVSVEEDGEGHRIAAYLGPHPRIVPVGAPGGPRG
jgi:hypothetical protein